MSHPPPRPGGGQSHPPTMKIADIRELSEAEIEKKLRETRATHLDLKMRKQTGQIEHPHEFKQLRRETARLETILKEKKLAAAR